MLELDVEFKRFVNESPKRIKYLLKIGDLLNQVTIRKFKIKPIEYGKLHSGIQLNEYVVEVKRNNLLSYITFKECLRFINDENSPFVEVILDGGDAYTLSEENIVFRSFSFSERLMLDVTISEEFLNALIIDFQLYKKIKQNE